MRRIIKLAVAAIVGASGLVAIQSGPAHAASCGWAYTKQEGKGGVSGAVLARHTFQSNYCWTATSTSSGSNTLHTAEEVGWTSLPMDVSTQGNTISRYGSSYIATGYARAQFCVVWSLGGCSTSSTYIKHTLKPGGVVSKVVPKWSV